MNLEEKNFKPVIRPLLSWYRKNKRILPWRQDPKPYNVWVSEIMLQQTRVEAVKPYYRRFMEALPTVRDLAECPEEQLLKLWEGLGYYNRVRNLQTAAQTIMSEYNGELPRDYKQLLSLKGIGSYTAGAVASISYGIYVPAVDGNVFRILMRLAGDDSDIAKPALRKRVEAYLLKIMETELKNCKGFEDNLPGMFNQALMELGATVCVPNGAPNCSLCPWREFCTACQKQLTELLPVKTKKIKRRIEERTILIIRDGERTILRKRPAKGLLAGLYEFPNFLGFLEEKEVLSAVREMDLNPLKIEALSEANHVFSHVEWRMKGFLVRVDSLTTEKTSEIFAELEELEENYPIPTAFSTYTKELQVILGYEKVKLSFKDDLLYTDTSM